VNPRRLSLFSNKTRKHRPLFQDKENIRTGSFYAAGRASLAAARIVVTRFHVIGFAPWSTSHGETNGWEISTQQPLSLPHNSSALIAIPALWKSTTSRRAIEIANGNCAKDIFPR